MVAFIEGNFEIEIEIFKNLFAIYVDLTFIENDFLKNFDYEPIINDFTKNARRTIFKWL